MSIENMSTAMRQIFDQDDEDEMQWLQACAVINELSTQSSGPKDSLELSDQKLMKVKKLEYINAESNASTYWHRLSRNGTF